MSQPESILSGQILGALRAQGVFCFKVHGNEYMMAGLPDIIACVPNEWGVGLFVGVETKMPGGEVSDIQKLQHARIRDAGGEVHVVGLRGESVEQIVRAVLL